MEYVDYQETIRSSRLRATPLRVFLLKTICELTKPQDVQSIVKNLEDQGIEFDNANVYRNLDTFVKKGLLKKIDLEKGKYYYEKAGPCIHLVCQKCGLIEHQKSALADSFVEELTNTSNFIVSEPTINLFGQCQTCE